MSVPAGTGLAGLLLIAVVATVSAQTPGPPASAIPPATPYTGTALSLGMIFTASFMVMLGPFKLVGPFVSLTAGMEEAAARKLR
ncbi:MAG TPA: hypothetical protein VLD61_10885 [Methylomirabilota bacterium]|nr:hypothetical protein [Methylomirabilota bacterium]